MATDFCANTIEFTGIIESPVQSLLGLCLNPSGTRDSMTAKLANVGLHLSELEKAFHP